MLLEATASCSLNGQMLINSAGEPMCNHFAGKQIQNNAKIIGPPTRLQISEVTHPNLIDRPRIETLVEHVFHGLAVPRFSVLEGRLHRAHGWKIHGFHQAVHSAVADADAMITLKANGDFLSAKAFGGLGVDV